MPNDIPLMLLGAAAVIDTALVLVLMERINRPRIFLPGAILAFGLWLYHIGLFIHGLTADLPSGVGRPIQWAALLAATAGLMIGPCSLVHGAARLWRSGLMARPPMEWRYVFAYLPLSGLIPASIHLWQNAELSFLEIYDDWAVPYVWFSSLVNVSCAFAAFRLHGRNDGPRARAFLKWAGVYLLCKTALYQALFLIALPLWPAMKDEYFIASALAPLVFALLFLYFVIRFRIMRLVFQRTVLYGVTIAGAILLYHFVITDIKTALSEELQFDIAVLEGAIVAVIILSFHPIRTRVAEALRYLLGSRVSEVREGARRLSLELSARSGLPEKALLDWFAESIRSMTEADAVAVLQSSQDLKIIVAAQTGRTIEEPLLLQLYKIVDEHGGYFTVGRDWDVPELARIFDDGDLSFAAQFRYEQTRGLLVLGRPARFRDFGEEEINHVLLLSEQLAIALHNGQLQKSRLEAERRAVQNEKLSTLGMLAGAIAHEVKNPLSSIKTITSVMAEQNGDGSPHKEDLQIILDEIDRLSGTVNRLLDTARPSQDHSKNIPIIDAIRDTTRMVRHLAHQRGVALQTSLPEAAGIFLADSHSLRELFLNLLINAIDAAGTGGTVGVRCEFKSGQLRFIVYDNGPGIEPELQDRIFEPFVTTKPDGTGLGLYIAGQRMVEMGGTIACHSPSDGGTEFVLTFPEKTDAVTDRMNRD